MSLAHDIRLRAPTVATTADTPLMAFGRWLGESALPRWRPDDHVVPFAECRGSDGVRADPGFVRLRVVSRQVSVHAQAAVRGVIADRDAVRGWRAMAERLWSPGHGWWTRVDSTGKGLDDRFDLYDQAFALYACAHQVRLDPTGQALDLADRTLALIDRRLRVAGQPGWRSTTAGPGRDQNGHMHFLEALLALHDVSPTLDVAARIEELLALVAERLVDPRSGAIPEWFEDDWRSIPDDRQWVEPGHQYEWVWLLAQAARRGFRSVIDAEALFGFADRHGWSIDTDLIVDACDRRGRVTAPAHRLWPHCEAIRAAAARPTWQGRALAERAAARMLHYFLDRPFAGGWTDRLDRLGAPVEMPVPATSLYHLWEAGLAAASRGWLHIGARPC